MSGASLDEHRSHRRGYSSFSTRVGALSGYLEYSFSVMRMVNRVVNDHMEDGASQTVYVFSLWP